MKRSINWEIKTIPALVDIAFRFDYFSWVRILTFIIIVVSMTGCDSIFSTREPEPPNDDTGRSLWQQPTSPETVLLNLSNAFAERNVENYVRSLSDSAISGRHFVFIPDQETAVSNVGAFLDWGIENERQYITLMFSSDVLSSDSLVSLTFEHFSEQTIPTDTATFEEIYEMTIEHELENVPQRMKGIARFRLAKDAGGNWSIYYWEDFAFVEPDAGTSLPTWSEMKARAN